MSISVCLSVCLSACITLPSFCACCLWCMLPGNVTHYLIPLDDDEGSANVPPTLAVTFHNGASLTLQGRVKAALMLRSSRHYISINEPHPTCFSNLQLCHTGICIAFYLKVSNALPPHNVQLVKSHTYSVRQPFLFSDVCFLNTLT